MSVSKNTIKKIGHCACLGDIKGQTYPIYACTGTNHVASFHRFTKHFAAAGSKGFLCAAEDA